MVAASTWVEAVLDDDEAEDEELWHAEIAGEVKVLSLEQLDDLYRIEVIDESTRLWKPGMRGWTRLGIVAGIEPEPSLSAVAASRTPAPPAPRSPAPVTPIRPPAPVVSAANDYNPFLAPAKPVVVAPVSAPLPAPYTALASAPYKAPSPAPYKAPDSLRPLALDDIPIPAPRQRSSRAGSFILLLAGLCGLGVTLYRNDVLRDAARSAGQTGLYSRLEAAVGAPGFGTLRSIEAMTASSLSTGSLGATTTTATPAPPETKAAGAEPLNPSAASTPTTSPASVNAKEAEPAPIPLEALAKEAAETRRETDAPKTFDLRPTGKTAQKQDGRAQKPEEKSAEDKPKKRPSLKEAMRQALGRDAKPAKRAGARRSGESGKPAAPIGIKGSSHAYDPLNPKL